MFTSVKHSVKTRLSPQSWDRLKRLAAACRLYSRDAAEVSKLEMAERKIRQIDGKVDQNYIEVAGVRLKNCYRDFALVVAENLYYQHYKISLKGQWLAIDIGANAGVSSLFFAQNAHVARIYAFEPVAPIYKMLEDNLALNPELTRKIEIHNFGLGDKDESLTIPYLQDQAMSVSSKGTYNIFFNKVDSMETIAIKDSAAAIRDILSKHPNEKVMLKMDCEGAEFEILPHLSKHKLLDRVDVVMMEFHGRGPKELLSILDRDGFISFTAWTRRDLNIGMIKAVRHR